MPSALELIRAAQIERPDATALAEARERQTPPSTQIKVVSVGANGITGTTTNGGELTVFSGAQNFTPRAGDILPVNFTAGVARAIDNSRPETTVAPSPPSIPIVNTRAPTTDDGTTPYQLWYDISPGISGNIRLAELWALLPQLGAWHKVSGGGGTSIQFADGPPVLDPVDPINNPPPGNPSDGHIWHDRSLADYSDSVIGREWRYQLSTNQYRAVTGAITFFGADPVGLGLDAASLIHGDRLISTNQGTSEVWEYAWDASAQDWVGISCCPNQPPEPPTEDEAGCPPGSSWFDNGSPWGACTSE